MVKSKKFKLTEQVEQGIKDLEVEVLFENGQICIKVPVVRTGGEYPGESVPIVIEQADSKLFVRLYDDSSDEPCYRKSWALSLATPEALEDAKKEWEKGG